MRDDWKNALLADTAVLFAAASTRGLVSVVSVLSSLYPVVVALARTVLAERIARAQQAGVVLALGRRRDQSGIRQGPFRPGCHFGNVAYASFGDVVSFSTPAPCRRASSERG